MSQTRNLAALIVIVASSVNARPATGGAEARIGELFFTATRVDTAATIKVRPKPGFHGVRITGTVKNVGKHALCTYVLGCEDFLGTALQTRPVCLCRRNS